MSKKEIPSKKGREVTSVAASETKDSLKKKELVLVLPDIRSAYNVGSIFRTADAAGISHIYMSGYTPRPLDRFERPQKEIAKTALGAEKTILWTYEKEYSLIKKKLQKEGFEMVAIEQSEHSSDYKTYIPKNKTAFVVGNEVQGLPEEIMKGCDEAIEIPMKGKKESLNVVVALGVVLFRVLKI